MARKIPLTNITKYMLVAEGIQRDLRKNPRSPAVVRRAVLDLTDLVAKGLEEAAQVFEGLTMVVFSHHPDVTGGPRRGTSAPRSHPGRRRVVA
jgi:hypothetical protein